VAGVVARTAGRGAADEEPKNKRMVVAAGDVAATSS
jgi:hypothetical protein